MYLAAHDRLNIDIIVSLWTLTSEVNAQAVVMLTMLLCFFCSMAFSWSIAAEV